MNRRDNLITWGLVILAAVGSALLSKWLGVPIVIPPPQQEDRKPDTPPQPPPPPTPKPDTLAAIVRISAPGVGCTATVIGPRRADGRYWVLSAAHCVSGTGQTWTMKFRDGRTGGATVVNFDRRSDHCWMLTTSNTEEYPYALLSESTPPPGTPIWHAGFGVDNPANREDGTIMGVPNTDGQIQMKLSVSSGDSGGGIAITADGRVVSCVCCTSARGRVADVWGASVESVRRGQVAVVNVDDWTPTPIPLRQEHKKNDNPQP